MKLVFITTADPLYLPQFFERVLDHCEETVSAVYIAPPLYKNERAWSAAKKYFRTFGIFDTSILAWRVLCAKMKHQSIENTCHRHGIPCSNVPDVNHPDFLNQLKDQAPDLIISVSCPQIFKKPLIELPRKGILNLHGALLPEYRGVMPSFWMMANGETKAGVSIYFVNEKIDAGDLCGQKIFNIGRHESLDQFLQRSKHIAADLLLNTLLRIKKDKLRREPLNLSQGSYYSWPTTEAVKRFRSAGHQMW